MVGWSMNFPAAEQQGIRGQKSESDSYQDCILRVAFKKKERTAASCGELNPNRD